MKNLIIPAIREPKNTGHDVPDSLVDWSIREAVRARYAAPSELHFIKEKNHECINTDEQV